MNEELKACPPFKRFTRTYEDGKAWLPASGVTLAGNGEFTGPAIDRLALYESLLQMEPAEAALKLRRAAPENKPLTLEELRGMDGEPVWIKADHYGTYADVVNLVGKEDGENWVSFAINSRLRENGYGKTWLAYARKPEGNEP